MKLHDFGDPLESWDKGRSRGGCRSMKILVIGNRDRYEKYMPDMEIVKQVELIFCSRNTPEEELLEKGKDAEMILADAIAPVRRQLMEQMPNLRVVHSEGVAYNAIDIEGARQLGIDVCNNKGANAGAVAEQAIMLMLACLRDAVRGHADVMAGRQIRTKERKMAEGIPDLEDCRVGLVGFGDIAKAVAVRLSGFGCSLYYYSAHRKTREVEERYRVTYLPLEQLLENCDIISMHTAVTPQTTGMVNEEFLSHMKKTAFLINTARGEIVDNMALRSALIEGRIAGAGLDTIAPEPTTADNPLVDLPKNCRATVVYSPHLGGITSGSFRRIYCNLWSNVERVYNGEKPVNIVN